MKIKIKYNYGKKIRVFILVQILILFISFGIYFLNSNSIIEFYAFLIGFTMMDLIILEIILLLIYNTYKSRIFKERMSLLFNSILITGLVIFFINYTIKYYKDIPYVLSGEYCSVEGECTNSYENRGRAPHLDITVDGVEFNVKSGYKKSIIIGKTYKIEYLPNTKEVMEVYTVEKIPIQN